MDRRIVIAASSAAVIGLLAGGGAVWAAREKRVTELEARIADLYAQRETIEESVTPPASVIPSAAVPPAEQPKTPDTTEETSRQFTFITKVSGATVTADYAQFLTGDAAAKAAAAAGDESPPPNDYYVVNENGKLRTLKVKPGISVRLVSNADGTADPAGYTAPFDTWAGYYAAPSDENAAIRDSGYWITLQGDTVIAIEEQYVP